jgi:hypothetical protein
MMRWNGFSRSVLFGAAAAAAFAPVALTLSPWLGVQWSLVVFAALAVPLYLTGLGDTRRRGVTAALFAMLGIAGVGVLGATPREALVAAAVVLGLARSGLAYPGPFVRSAVLESALLAGGLMVANVLIGSSTLSVVLAVWGFFLVQSFFFLVVGARPIAAPRRVDPFDEARDRAIAIMDEPVGLG